MPISIRRRNVHAWQGTITQQGVRLMMRQGLTVADTVETWVMGWAVSRCTPPPVEKPWGFYIEVAGKAVEVGRHVLPETDESLVRRAAASVTAPRTWMKMPGEPEEIEPWLSPGWVMAYEETGHLMATDLKVTHPVEPEGYTVTVETIGSVIHARVHDAGGRQAAQGQMAVVAEAAVADQVVTDDAHRRRGLGRFVMRTLADHALKEGAHVGVLGATDAGRALYETLGWTKHATLAEAVYRP
ncbi:GNAT family N-acetyltransferase [Streptomyces sp. NPDC041068]|uniref:GNAT family N-acetyltransferase n=1 Tax=Streptomyces sp. NPDC041068 TaxID=3155130 RepID=UPI0033EF136F